MSELKTLTEVYIEPLSESNVITAEQHSLLFNNIPTLLKLNERFKQALDAKYRNWNPSTSKIGDDFLEFAPYFTMYQGYLNNHDDASDLVTKLEKSSKEFAHFCELAQFDERCNEQNLKSYLIKPIQRITKYELLLRELLKHTLSDHPDYSDLTKAMAKINEVNTAINEKMKSFDQRQKVRDIDVDLVSPDRWLVKRGKLTKICRKRDIEYAFVLFSNLLIYGEEAKENQIKIHQQLAINQSFRIMDIPPNVQRHTKFGGNAFEIHSEIKSFIVYAQSNALKNEWFAEIDRMIQNAKSIKPRSEKRRMRLAPLWVPDDFTTHCMVEHCDKKFGGLTRRHHCRYCGRLICGKCSTQRLSHWTKKNKTVRVCDQCYDENTDNAMHHILDDQNSMSADSDIFFEFWDSDVDHSFSEMQQTNAFITAGADDECDDDFKATPGGSKVQKVLGMNSKENQFAHWAKVFVLRHKKDRSHSQSRSEVDGFALNDAFNPLLAEDEQKTMPKKEELTEQKANSLQIERALYIIKKSREENIVSTADCIKYLMHRSSSVAVIEYALNKCGIHMDEDAIYSIAGILRPIQISQSESIEMDMIQSISPSVSMPSSPSMQFVKSPRSPSMKSKRLKLVGTGTLKMDKSDSMKLHTVNGVIEWMLDPMLINPRKKDNFSCYIKALNLSSLQNDILMIRITNKDVMDKLMSLLLTKVAEDQWE